MGRYVEETGCAEMEAVSMNLFGGICTMNENFSQLFRHDTNLVPPEYKSKNLPLHPPKVR
jgi:hypothetical protein